MLWKKLACSVAALLALTVAYVRPVCTVSLGGQELPGLWAPGDVAGAERIARSASEEISRSGEDMPEVETHLKLAVLPETGERGELALTLLAESPGVDRAWDVSVDGIVVGRAGDRSALGELLMDAIAEAAPAGSIRTGFTSDIELSEVFAPEGTLTDLMELSSRIRSLVRVTYTTSDGQLHYA